MEKHSDQKDAIEALRKAFSIPIIKGRLNRELLKIKKSDLDDLELINSLRELYIHYELQNQVKRQEEGIKSPRILYSKYLEQKIG